MNDILPHLILNTQHARPPTGPTHRHQIHTSVDTNPHTEQSAAPRQASHSC